MASSQFRSYAADLIYTGFASILQGWMKILLSGIAGRSFHICCKGSRFVLTVPPPTHFIYKIFYCIPGTDHAVNTDFRSNKMPDWCSTILKSSVFQVFFLSWAHTLYQTTVFYKWWNTWNRSTKPPLSIVTTAMLAEPSNPDITYVPPNAGTYSPLWGDLC